MSQVAKRIVSLMSVSLFSLFSLFGVLGFLSNFSYAELSQIPITCNGVTATGMAINFNQLAQAQSFSYVSSVDANNWSGHLKAYSVSNTGVVSATPSWDAATALPAWDKRNIVTWNGSNAAVNFDWSQLTEAQKTALGSEDVLRYLKGYDGQEVGQTNGQTTGIYRTRTNKLGDIVHSSPVYVQKANFSYQAIPAAQGGGALYRTFMKTKESRNPMVYVGANDGMLHGFDALTGVEQFAFIPNVVYPNLKKLSDANYAHQYFVDGQLSEGDAYSANGWKTVLLGSTGAGAKSLFALDITTPTTINVLWEKNASSDDDQGYVLGKGTVVRLRNGEWAAIYGNGVDSVNKKSVLYLVNVFTGNLIAKIDTGSGSASMPNGLSTPALVFNNEREVIAAYAGDMQGRLWKFDLSDVDKTKWQVAYSGNPLFIAKDSNAQVQPILQKPAIAYHPKGGYLILLGTGVSEEYASSNTNTSINSVYGIWDKPGANAITASRSTTLQEQTLTPTQGGASLSNAAVDWVNQRGWVIDLNLSSGERAVGDPVVTDDILWLSTSDATSTNCGNGSQSRLMGVDYLTGGAVKVPVFEQSSYSVMNMQGAIAGVSNMLTMSSTSSFSSSQAGMQIPNKTKKIITLHVDGSTETQTLKIKSKPPLRVWHQLFMS